MLKRLFDFICSLTVFVFLAIPILVDALAVKLTSLGPVFYCSVGSAGIDMAPVYDLLNLDCTPPNMTAIFP
jgi:lipopolysaccharide/colanic/teichoic acid biosynthesis glycosyltransferase